MANMTLSIPDELIKKMKSFNEVKWSEIARKAIEKRVEDLEIMNELASKSKLTERDIREISKRIKASAARKF